MFSCSMKDGHLFWLRWHQRVSVRSASRGFPFVCFCSCILRCPTACLGRDPRSCLHPQSSVLWLPRSLFLRCSLEELVFHPDSDLAYTHQMERCSVKWSARRQRRSRWERERGRERVRMHVCWEGDWSLWVIVWICLSHRGGLATNSSLL